jgi:RNA polymerase sigma factor (sigma-70 family)
MSKRQAEIVLGQLQRLTSASDSDRRLLERFAAGREEAAFAELLRRHGPMVLRLCQRILGDAHEAEDAFQAAFLLLARKAGAIRQHESVASWLYKVAARIALRARAAAARRKELPQRLPPPLVADPLAEVNGRELLQILDDELLRLPEKYRAPLLLCYLQGQTQDEAARQLGLRPAVLRGRIERGRAVLRQRLVKRGLGLSVVLSMMLIEQAAAVPALLRGRTLRAALSSPLERAALSASVATFVESGIHALNASKMKLTATFCLLLSLAVIGGGVVALQRPTEKAAPAQTNHPPQKARRTDMPSVAERRDLLGDPLPDGVLARLGTSRLRHGGWFTAMAYAPDGKTIATAAHDATVRLWDAADGKAVRVLGQGGERRFAGSTSRWLFCIAFTPDGKHLAAGEHVADLPAGKIHVWDTASGKEERRYLAHPGGVAAVAFSPDGKTLASSGAKDGKVRLWDAATGKEVHALDAPESPRWLAFSPDGKTLASAGGKVIRLWNSDKGAERKQLQGHRDNLSGLAFRPDGKELASVGKDKTLRLWNVDTGRQRACWTAADDLAGVAFSPDGKTLATGGPGPILLWDAATGKEERRLRHPPGEVAALAFARDGKTLATSTIDERCVRLWDVQSGEERRASAAGHHGAVGFLRFSPDGQALLSSGWEDLEMCRWKTATGERLWQIHRGRHDFAKLVDLSPDGKVLAAGTPSGTILLVDALSGKEIAGYEAHREPVESLAFSPDGKTLATSAKDKTVRLWDVAARRQKLSLDMPVVVPFVRFAPDGKTLASAAAAGPIELRDPANGRVRLRLEGQIGQICSLKFSPDSRWCAAGTQAGSVQVWDTVSGQPAYRLNGHSGFVFALAFSHDGRTLATGSWMQLRLWETATAQERVHFTDIEGDVFALDFAPSDRVVASGPGDGSILLWDAAGRLAGKPPSNEDEDKARLALLGQDGSKAYRALWTLAASPGRTLPWLKTQLKPVVDRDHREIEGLIRQMDDDDFRIREAARRDLAKEVELAEPLLRKALQGKPSAELRRRIEQLLEPLSRPLPPPERVRQLRLLELLERIGTPEAVALLKTLAGGAPGVFLTREAKAALARRAAHR